MEACNGIRTNPIPAYDEVGTSGSGSEADSTGGSSSNENDDEDDNTLSANQEKKVEEIEGMLIELGERLGSFVGATSRSTEEELEHQEKKLERLEKVRQNAWVKLGSIVGKENDKPQHMFRNAIKGLRGRSNYPKKRAVVVKHMNKFLNSEEGKRETDQLCFKDVETIIKTLFPKSSKRGLAHDLAKELVHDTSKLLQEKRDKEYWARWGSFLPKDSAPLSDDPASLELALEQNDADAEPGLKQYKEIKQRMTALQIRQTLDEDNGDNESPEESSEEGDEEMEMDASSESDGEIDDDNDDGGKSPGPETESSAVDSALKQIEVMTIDESTQESSSSVSSIATHLSSSAQAAAGTNSTASSASGSSGSSSSGSSSSGSSSSGSSSSGSGSDSDSSSDLDTDSDIPVIELDSD